MAVPATQRLRGVESYALLRMFRVVRFDVILAIQLPGYKNIEAPLLHIVAVPATQRLRGVESYALLRMFRMLGDEVILPMQLLGYKNIEATL